MASDPAVHAYDDGAGPSRSVRETRKRLSLQVMANGGMSWAVRLRGPDDLGGPATAIGTIGVFADQGTTIRGVGWSLASSYWRRGIMSEAARIVIPFLLAQDGVDGVEAWVDSANVASVRVALAAGMAERARLPRVYADRVAQTVVMARAAAPVDPTTYAVTATMLVADVRESVRLLTGVLGLHLAWEVLGPPATAFLAVEPWSGSPGVRLVEAAAVGAERPVPPLFEVGTSVDALVERAKVAGLRVVEPPIDEPWGRREVGLGLPDGTVVRVSGPSTPPGDAR